MTHTLRQQPGAPGRISRRATPAAAPGRSPAPRGSSFALLAVGLAVALAALVIACGRSKEGDPRGSEGAASSAAASRLKIFVGAASKPPVEDVVALFEEKTGTRVDVTFGGSGFVLSQMILAKDGDIYFPGSSDFMEKAKREGHVDARTEKRVVYLVSAINVKRGNPKGIRSLKDLLRPDVRVAIGNPETVCVGTYAVEIVEAALGEADRDAFRAKLANYTESCERTATAVSLGSVDAVIGWSVFEHWDPERIETVPLPASQVRRVGYIPIAISSYSKQPELAQRFIDFVLSEEGQAVFRKHKYFMTPEEAHAYAGEEKPVGGDFALPDRWRAK